MEILFENSKKTNVGADENRPYTLWFFILLEWMLEVNPTMQINGVVVLSDMTSFSYSHLRWIMTHPRALQERITSIQDAVPMRIKDWIIFSKLVAGLSTLKKENFQNALLSLHSQ